MNIDIPIGMIQSRNGKWRVPLSLNYRIHRMEEWRRQQDIKRQVAYHIHHAMKQHNLTTQQHITTQLHYHPGDNRHRDPDNLAATTKPAVDGLKGTLIPDDDTRYCTQLQAHIHPGKGPTLLYLRVTLP